MDQWVGGVCIVLGDCDGRVVCLWEYDALHVWYCYGHTSVCPYQPHVWSYYDNAVWPYGLHADMCLRDGFSCCMMMTRVRILDRKSPRLKGYDYAKAWWYFITFNTKDRVQSLCAISPSTIVGTYGNVSLELTEIWEVCKNEIVHTQTLRKDVIVDEYVVMPDHVHIILLLTDQVPCQTLWSIIRNIKARVTKYANSKNIPFARQGRYHDHIIRDDKDLDRIRKYIRENPMKWVEKNGK